jgi:hypothetical protein
LILNGEREKILKKTLSSNFVNWFPKKSKKPHLTLRRGAECGLDRATLIFEDPRKRDKNLQKQENQEAVLQQKVGQLTMENDWLKKKLNL